MSQREMCTEDNRDLTLFHIPTCNLGSSSCNLCEILVSVSGA